MLRLLERAHAESSRDQQNQGDSDLPDHEHVSRQHAAVRAVPVSPLFSAEVRSCLTDRNVGRMPSRRPVPRDTASVNSRTRRSMPASSEISIGRGGVSVSSPRVAALATASPHTPPRSEMSRLSVSSCRTSRARLAPSDARIANSLRRARERASSRLAIFAQAMSRTSATIPSRPQPSSATPEAAAFGCLAPSGREAPDAGSRRVASVRDGVPRSRARLLPGSA